MLYFPPPPTTTITNIKHHLDKNILNTATISFMDDEFDFILNFRWIVFVSIVLLDDLTAVVDTARLLLFASGGAGGKEKGAVVDWGYEWKW